MVMIWSPMVFDGLQWSGRPSCLVLFSIAMDGWTYGWIGWVDSVHWTHGWTYDNLVSSCYPLDGWTHAARDNHLCLPGNFPSSHHRRAMIDSARRKTES